MRWSRSPDSLVGGPAYNDTDAAQEMLEALDVPYLAVQGLEFQAFRTGVLLHGRCQSGDHDGGDPGARRRYRFNGVGDAQSFHLAKNSTCNRHASGLIASRTALPTGALRHTPIAERKVAIVLFNFPPNSGAAVPRRTSASSSPYSIRSRRCGRRYHVACRFHAELRDAILKGNAKQFGAEANVFQRVPVDDLCWSPGSQRSRRNGGRHR